MKSRETIRIAVAETSVILRSGIVAALKRAATVSIQFIEIDSPDNFISKIRPYSPNILIINPLFGGHFEMVRLKADKDLGLVDTKMVALLTSAADASLLTGFDGTITLYHTEAQLAEMLDTLMGYADTETPAQNDGQLSQREKEIIREVVKGKTNKEIATHFNLSVFTVLTHRRNIAKKLQIHSATALAIYAITNKLVTINEVK